MSTSFIVSVNVTFVTFVALTNAVTVDVTVKSDIDAYF